MKKFRVTIDGKAYDVLVEILDEGSPTTAPPPSPAPKAASPAGGAEITSPLAGKVVSIDVTAGQTVASGAQVATVEAMKMNTYIYAPRAGTISAVLVNPGDSVEEGMAIMRLS